MYRFYEDAKGYPRWKNSNILVHRTVAANMLGSKIPSGHVVHHIDRNKRNFRKNNLMIMTRSEHSKLHYNYLNKKYY